MREPDKTCPACGLLCGPAEPRCDCGHAFEVTESQRRAASDQNRKGCLLALAVLNPALGLVGLLGWMLAGLRRPKPDKTSAGETHTEEEARA